MQSSSQKTSASTNAKISSKTQAEAAVKLINIVEKRLHEVNEAELEAKRQAITTTATASSKSRKKTMEKGRDQEKDKDDKDKDSDEKDKDGENTNGVIEIDNKDSAPIDRLFSTRSKVLYLLTLGDSYLKLRSYYESRDSQRLTAKTEDEFLKRGVKAFKDAFKATDKAFEAASYLRVLACHRYCCALTTFRKSDYEAHFSKARSLARKVYTAAIAHDQYISDEALEVLQKLRDDYVSVLDAHHMANADAHSPLHTATKNIANNQTGGFGTTDAMTDLTNKRKGADEGKSNPNGLGPKNSAIVAYDPKEVDPRQLEKMLNRKKGSIDKFNKGKFMYVGTTEDAPIFPGKEMKAEDDDYDDDDEDTYIDTSDEEQGGQQSDNLEGAGIRRQTSSSKLTNYVDIVAKVRGILSLPNPVIIESLPISNVAIHVLSKIFTVYVRGNAVPGALRGGSLVDLDGQAISFTKFMLEGPYMSWRGFLNILRDFSIMPRDVLAEPLSTEQIRSKKYNFDGKFYQVPGVGQQQVLTLNLALEDLAIIFIESSRSVKPVLVFENDVSTYVELSKSMKDPKDLVHASEPGLARTGSTRNMKTAKPPTQDSEGPDMDKDNDKEKSPTDSEVAWDTCRSWVQKDFQSTDDINAGLNFMQFVDCLGKCGQLMYSGDRFATIFKDAQGRIEHFLAANLMVNDIGQWKRRVEARMKVSQQTIERVKDS